MRDHWAWTVGFGALAYFFVAAPAAAASDLPAAARERIEAYEQAVEQHRKAHGETVRGALDKWNARLDELLETARKKGDLDGLLALQAEREGADRTDAAPTAKLPGEAAAAKRTHEDTLRKADQEFDRKGEAAHAKLVADLERIEKEETQRNRLEAAVAVRDARRARERDGPPHLAERQASAAEDKTAPAWFGRFGDALTDLTRRLRTRVVETGDGPVAVVWLIDASVSLEGRRRELGDALEQIQGEVAGPEGPERRAVSLGVAVFGEGYAAPLLPPTDQASQAAAAIRGLASDGSGKERLCAAVLALCSKVETWRGDRRVIVVIVTDERGDDLERLEEAVKSVRNAGVTLFALAAESPFGVAQGRYPWRESNGSVHWLTIDAGPETPFPEWGPTPEWGEPVPDRGLPIASGFGPYSLGRLCEGTGGACLAVAMEGYATHAPETMVRYRPDWRSPRECETDLKANKAKSAVTQLAREWSGKTATQLGLPRLQFAADKSGTRTARTRGVREADEFLRKLDKGLAAFREAEPDRKGLREPRWRAAFDLHRGQLLALRARVVRYRKLLMESQSDPALAKTPGLTLRRVAADWSSDEARAARELLERVAAEHPGTPWSRLAEQSLAEPTGWQWEAAAPPAP